MAYVSTIQRAILDRKENIAGKGENTGYQQFLPFPQCFLRPVKKENIVGKGEKSHIPHFLLFPVCFVMPAWKENIVGKGKKAGNQHFCPFPTMFSNAFEFKLIKNQNCVVKC